MASNVAAISSVTSRYEGTLEFEEVRTVTTEEVDANGRPVEVVIGRLGEMRIMSPKGLMLTNARIPYGSKLYFSNGDSVSKGDVICEWDPFNAVIVSEMDGVVRYNNLIENVTYRVEADEHSGVSEKIIIESKDRTKAAEAQIVDTNGRVLRTYSLPVGAHLILDDNSEIKAGQIFVKTPRSAGSAGDITGGLPRVTELFEARNPSNPAIVAEIDGEVTLGSIKRGNKEVTVTSLLAMSRNISYHCRNRSSFRTTTMCAPVLPSPTVPSLPPTSSPSWARLPCRNTSSTMFRTCIACRV